MSIASFGFPSARLPLQGGYGGYGGFGQFQSPMTGSYGGYGGQYGSPYGSPYGMGGGFGGYSGYGGGMQGRVQGFYGTLPGRQFPAMQQSPWSASPHMMPQMGQMRMPYQGQFNQLAGMLSGYGSPQGYNPYMGPFFSPQSVGINPYSGPPLFNTREPGHNPITGKAPVFEAPQPGRPAITGGA